MPVLVEDDPIASGFLKLYKGFANVVASYGDCDIYAAKILKWSRKKILSSLFDAAEPMRNGFCVLCHGDLWLNNLMFKSDGENNPIDVSIIDFQVCFWGSPACDLFCFLLSSVADCVKIEHFDDLIEFYHEALTSSMKKLSYEMNVPTLVELHTDLLDKGNYGL